MTNATESEAHSAFNAAAERLRAALQSRREATDRANDAICAWNNANDQTNPDFHRPGHNERWMDAERRMRENEGPLQAARDAVKKAQSAYDTARSAYLAEGGMISRLMKRIRLIGK